PELRRLARKTSPGANGRPLTQIHRMRRMTRAAAPATDHHSHTDSPVTNADVKLIRLKEKFVAASRARLARAWPTDSLGKTNPILPPHGQPRDSASCRRGISGVQRRAVV